MKDKLITFIVYTLTISILTIISVKVGSELITQYKMYSEGYTGIERHHLADDLGFGMLLMFGLIPEILIGVVGGFFLGRKINEKVKRT